MSLLPVRYALSIFTGNSDLGPSGLNATKLITAFSKYDLIPSTFIELGGPGALPRLRLAKISGEWCINVASNRVDFEQQFIDKNPGNLSVLEGFCATSVDMAEIFLKTFPRKASRLAFATNDLLPEYDAEALSASFHKISSAFPYYKDHVPFEWVHRAAGLDSWGYSGSVESLNVITTISRIRGHIGISDPRAFDRVSVDFDINTNMAITDTRFSAEHLALFVARSSELRLQILDQVVALLK